MKKYISFVLISLSWLVFSMSISQAKSFLKEVENDVGKGVHKSGSAIKKDTHKVESWGKKSTKKLKVHKPKVKL